jgi:hypothetical protein
MINFTDNPLVIDVNSKRSIKQKILCVLCFPKIQLECINPEENRYRCPRCKNSYQLGFNEINEFSDELESSHSEESEFDDNGGLLVAEDEFSKDDNDISKSDIPVPKYMRDSETTKVTYFREE